jgi:putative transposase
MMIHRAYKVEIDPNNCQRTLLRKHAGAARWAYNWGLQRKISVYKETKKSPNNIALHRELNKLKKLSQEEGGVPWMYQVSKCAPQEALRDLDKAYSNFFRRCKKGSGKKGFPRFKSKRKSSNNFRLTGTIKTVLDGRYIQLPKLGRIKLKERGYLPEPSSSVKILSATVSERAGRWFVSLSVKKEIPDPKPQPKVKVVVGVDVGIKSLATTCDGAEYKNPKALYKATKKLRKLQRALSRKQKGSKNREKARARVAKAFFKVSCVRLDAIHKATASILRGADIVVIETLNVKGMLKNRKLARALSDASLSEFHRQIRYKAEWMGVEIVEAPRFYPSSKTCSGCGNVKQDLTLSDRTYKCGSCDLEIDRDLNAAINLRDLAGSSPVTARGEAVSPVEPLARQAVSMKQESNNDLTRSV